MDVFKEFLDKIDNSQNRARVEEVLHWVSDHFQNLEPKIAWNQPMFTDHGTFIIAFSVAKPHMAVAPERVAIQHFTEEIEKSAYEYTKELIRFPWDKEVDFALLERIIEYNILEKKECTTFWRK